MRCVVGATVLAIASCVAAKCYEPNPAFPVPTWQDKEVLRSTFQRIEDRISKIIASPIFDESAYAIEVTSGANTLWQNYHTARVVNESLPGAPEVNGSTHFRIASISKVFTTLSIIKQHDAGNLSLDDAVLEYIQEFQRADSGKLPWKDITLRTIASQLSGLPREFSQADLINQLPDPTVAGLPPASKHGLPTCDEYNDYQRSCGRKDLMKRLQQASPLFAPHQKSTYSNVNFDLLGLVLENVTGGSSTKYVHDTIFEPLEMTSSTFKTPPENRTAIPASDNYFWCKDLAISNPSGGIYSSSSDLSKFLRYVLTHYNTIGKANWLFPTSWSGGVNSFYGMPWEIFRTDKILPHSRRPVVFVTKGGSLPDYYSIIILIEEYGFGITILIAGAPGLFAQLREIITTELVRGADAAIWKHIDKTYTGAYTSIDPELRSFVELETSASHGLEVSKFVSNGTGVLDAGSLMLTEMFGSIADDAKSIHAQLVPTLLFKDEKAQQGEIWRMVGAYDRSEVAADQVWDDFCITDDDQTSYAGLPVNEVVFWQEKGLVELPAWNLTLRKAGHQDAKLTEQTYA